MKVKILVQNAQTRMLKVNSETEVDEKTAKHWIKNKWAKAVKTPEKKK